MMKESSHQKTWHDQHRETMSLGQIFADKLALGMGSWTFIIIQTVLVFLWIGLNFIGYIYHWDPYPFILLNLVFSIQAAYAAPIIMMAQNRQSDRDRLQAAEDYRTNIEAKKEIEQLQITLARIETEKLDQALKLLNGLKTSSKT